MQPFVIGIAGGSGSGKTTFANKIVEALGEQVTVLCHDFYYAPFADMPLEERKRQNFDHPASFDTALMAEQLSALKQGQPVERPVYSYTAFTRLGETVPLLPNPVIIVEGILILESRALRELMDIKIFVDTDPDVRFIRRLVRDMAQRDRSVDSVVRQYLSTVKPMHEQFVEPSKRYADVIVPQGGEIQVALEMVLERIRAQLAR